MEHRPTHVQHAAERNGLLLGPVSAIVSDTFSWLRLPPLIGIRLASTARSPTSSGPLDPNYGGETGLQGRLPLNTHRFFRPFGVREVPSHTGGEGGLKLGQI